MDGEQERDTRAELLKLWREYGKTITCSCRQNSPTRINGIENYPSLMIKVLWTPEDSNTGDILRRRGTSFVSGTQITVFLPAQSSCSTA